VTTKSYSALNTEIATALPDNTVGTITPGAFRGVMQDLIDSQGLKQYTVSTLPVGSEGMAAYTTDGRKVGEVSGAGSGVPVYFSNGLWRVPYNRAGSILREIK
jgi:hypothetical protein